MEDIIKRKILQTSDGSHTLFVPSLDEYYHSINGAIQESQHVFIQAGLNSLSKSKINILEIGFGTGLNAFLTWKETETNREIEHINYYTIELYPLEVELVEMLNYGELVWKEKKENYLRLHSCEWNRKIDLDMKFNLTKIKGDANYVALPTPVDLIYFDAFAPDKQPEMWNSEIFQKLFTTLSSGGVIVTYCAKGEVRRRMQSVGFEMKRLPGPPGKRHILLGMKP